MSAKKLGRFTAGLFVALGLAFGGSLMAGADNSPAAKAAGHTATIGAIAQQYEFEWT